MSAVGRGFTVARAFKRLGSWIHVRGKNRKEIAQHAASAKLALYGLSRPVLDIGIIPTNYKDMFVRALVLSRLLFAVE
eukprot:8871258-Lingulodinium_polyedra.AAC.1